MGRRVYTTTFRCAEPGCRETSFCESTSRAEEAETYARYARHPYRCYRHSRPDEVMSADNPATTAIRTAHETKYGIYWGITPDKATSGIASGIASGPGFRAIAKDFPPGTRLIVTARIEFPEPEPADCPPGCTLSCCVPTQEQSAEVAEMLRKPMTFPIEDEEVPF